MDRNRNALQNFANIQVKHYEKLRETVKFNFYAEFKHEISHNYFYLYSIQSLLLP